MHSVSATFSVWETPQVETVDWIHCKIAATNQASRVNCELPLTELCVVYSDKTSFVQTRTRGFGRGLPGRVQNKGWGNAV